jgi:hypothetical protein
MHTLWMVACFDFFFFFFFFFFFHHQEPFVKLAKPNPQYKEDSDITYGELTKLIAGRVPGLLALLQTLKRQKKVDFNNEGDEHFEFILLCYIYFDLLVLGGMLKERT